jgi:hypothetical protein
MFLWVRKYDVETQFFTSSATQTANPTLTSSASTQISLPSSSLYPSPSSTSQSAPSTNEDLTPSTTIPEIGAPMLFVVLAVVTVTFILFKKKQLKGKQ